MRRAIHCTWLPGLGELGVDLFWDTSGSDNCWEDNVFDTSFPPSLPACPADGA